MTVRILIGDARERLKELPDESVHCCVTSPPYFGLRDYGTAQWDGGDPECDHLQKTGQQQDTGKMYVSQHLAKLPFRHLCGKCGARRIDNQIGLEASGEEYLAEMVAVFREVRRVLRKDGTLWINLGDSYASSVNGRKAVDIVNDDRTFRDKPISTVGTWGTKPKDILGIPWRVAFALQADGWWLRQDIIWHKPNPMPESVTDRCTKSHEYIFLLSKSERYWYDAEAIKEASLDDASYKPRTPRNADKREGDSYFATKVGDHANGKTYETRNKRSVWSITTQPFTEAHFATFPPELPELCIKAGCPPSGTVLDPFGGAGTTGLVADRLGRSAVLIELNPAYAELARSRIHGDAPMFAQVAAE
jgi:DNA modification methylase